MALANIGLEVGAPLVFALATTPYTVLATTNDQGCRCSDYPTYAAVAGVIAAPVVDAIFLAWDEERVVPLPLHPSIDVRRDRTTFGIAAAF